MKVIIIGLGPQGLFLIRELARADYEVTVIGKKNEIGYFSKFGRKIEIQNELDLINKIKEMQDIFYGTDCHITSGFYLSFLLKNVPEFWKIFNVYPHPYESVKIFNNKIETYKVAQKNGIQVLESFILSDVEQNTERPFPYPMIAKWLQDINLFSKPKFKTAVLQNSKELKKIIETTSNYERENIIIQEYLGNDFKDNFSFGGFFKDGECLAGILVQQEKQYPMGLSSYVKEYNGKYSFKLIDDAKKIFKYMNFSGFGEAEFKYVKKNKRFILLEVNPRTWGWVKILKQKYPNIIKSIEGDPLKPISHRCKWTNVLRNAQTLKSDLTFDNLSNYISSHVRSLYDIWDIRDLKPFFYQLKRKLTV